MKLELVKIKGSGVGGGGGATFKNRPSHHKYKSPKQFLRTAYLETSELKGSNRT